MGIKYFFKYRVALSISKLGKLYALQLTRKTKNIYCKIHLKLKTMHNKAL